MSINYIIATYNGKCKRNHTYPNVQDVLKIHLEQLHLLKHSLTQITIMKAKSTNYYKDYYDIKEIIGKFNITVIEIECENYGYSEGQWMLAYEMFKNDFDYFMFVEDDYCPNIDNFDNVLMNIYKQKFVDGIGLLCSLVQGTKNYKKEKNSLPIHWEGSVLANKKTMKHLYSFPKWEGNPRKWLDLIDTSVDDGYDWHSIKQHYVGAYYQLTFSHLFTLSGIEHKDYLDVVNNLEELSLPYWSDIPSNTLGGKLCVYEKNNTIKKIYTLEHIQNAPIVPIQVHNIKHIALNTSIKIDIPVKNNNITKTIIFIIGMHRCGTSLLSKCLVDNGFTIGKSKNTDKNWQNPNGYYENDEFTKVHEQLLKHNNSTWCSIKSPHDMKYTQKHVDTYKQLLNTEFEKDENYILIKDPRLTFFTEFLKTVCRDEYNPQFIFLTRNEKECVDSICKAQNIKSIVATKLRNDTENCYNPQHLKINHKHILNNHDMVMKLIQNTFKISLHNNTSQNIDMKLYRNRNN
jgi:hypothetical protein